MAESLSISARVTLSWTYTNSPGYGDTVNSNNFAFTGTLSQGTGANGTADLLYITSGTLAGAATLSLDLVGVLKNVFGDTLTMARVKAFYLENQNATTSTGLKVGNAGVNPFVGWFGAGTHTEEVRNGGIVFRFCADATAWAVNASTAHVLLITNEDGTNTATYRLAIVASSA